MEIPDGMLPKIHVPVLQFHGLDDTALLYPALDGSWEQMEKDFTLVTIPGVGHWAQRDAAELEWFAYHPSLIDAPTYFGMI